MKKITSKNLSKRLAQYGAMSAAVMAGADANGQVVYVDLDPDVTVNVGDPYYELDFNSDGFVNLEVRNMKMVVAPDLLLYILVQVVH